MISAVVRSKKMGRSGIRNAALGFITLVLVIQAAPCLGWGPDGHRIIGDIATKYLSAKSKAAIKELLGEQTLADAGNWADEIRKDPQYDWVKPLHYINVPRDAAKVDLKRDCPDDKCVLGAINHYAAVLKDKSATHDDKVIALKLLVHFVGDVHQPLHVSYEDDRGANSIKTRVFDQPKERNLHAVWDETLIERRMNGDRSAMEEAMLKQVTDAKLKKWRAATNPVEWANESLTITRQLYKDVPPNGQVMTIDEAYYAKHIDTVEDRLTAAGVRLAAMLNGIFGEDRAAATMRTSQTTTPDASLRAVVEILDSTSADPDTTRPRILFAGHGFRVSESGHILTTYHQIARTHHITVREADDRRFDAQVVHADPVQDIALLKVEDDGPAALNIPSGDGAVPTVGSKVYLLRFATATEKRILSGVCEKVEDRWNARVITSNLQTTYGDSGTPLLSDNGDLLGMNTNGGSFGSHSTLSVASVALRRIYDQYRDSSPVTTGGPPGNELAYLLRIWDLAEPTNAAAMRRYDVSLLALAALHGDSEIVKQIASTNAADINIANHGYAPLLLALLRRNDEAAQALMNGGADPNLAGVDKTYPLTLALTMQANKSVEQMIKAGVDRNVRDSVGYCALQDAILANNSVGARMLIEGGADVNCSGPMGVTPLIVASSQSMNQVVEALLKAGAKVDQEDSNHSAAIHYSIQNAGVETVRILLESGASPNLSGPDEVRPLMLAAGRGSLPMVELLLQRNAEVSAITSTGYSALMYAAAYGTAPVVEALIKAGANRDQSDSYGRKAADLAALRRDNDGPAIVSALAK
jgi:ankyrin repeat protein/S1-C subfamily serine protease